MGARRVGPPEGWPLGCVPDRLLDPITKDQERDILPFTSDLGF